jgi:N-acetylmuramoyl-L-alanine amidase
MKIKKIFNYKNTALLLVIIFFALHDISSPADSRYTPVFFNTAHQNLASVFFAESITAKQLQQKYQTKSLTSQKIRILIVPGHEPDFGGAEYRNIKERNINVVLATYLEDFLKTDTHYETIMARDEQKWNPVLEKYFTENATATLSFLETKKNEMSQLIQAGLVTEIIDGAPHKEAPTDVARRLYGINKWANESNIDIVLHLHLNDYPREDVTIPGDYSGFAIYVPESQYSNSTTTRAIAQNIFQRLSKFNAISNFEKENNGIIEDQELIAMGRYNTSDAPSMLIEYGYIYESQFTKPAVQNIVLKNTAFQIFLGIRDFFKKNTSATISQNNTMLPHRWKKDMTKNNKNTSDALSLQTAFTLEGIYPPDQKTKNECPISGVFGHCTTESLQLFQSKYQITGEDNIVGTTTRKLLNEKYAQ